MTRTRRERQIQAQRKLADAQAALDKTERELEEVKAKRDELIRQQNWLSYILYCRRFNNDKR